MNISKSRMSEEGRIRYDWIKDWKVGDLLTNDRGDTMLIAGIDLNQMGSWSYEGSRYERHYPNHRVGSTYAKLLINNLTRSENYACFISYTMKDFAGPLCFGESREGKPALPFWDLARKGEIEAEAERQEAEKRALKAAQFAFDGLIWDWFGPWEQAIVKNPVEFMAYMKTITEVKGKPVSDVQLVHWRVKPMRGCGIGKYDGSMELDVRVNYKLDGEETSGDNNQLWEFNTGDEWQPWGTQ